MVSNPFSNPLDNWNPMNQFPMNQLPFNRGGTQSNDPLPTMQSMVQASGGDPSGMTNQPAANPSNSVLGWLQTIPAMVGNVPRQAAADAQGASAGMDPLNMQLYFAQTLGPMLSGLANQQQNQMNTYQQGMNALMDHVALPPGMKGIMQANQQQQLGDLSGLHSALQGAALATPGYDALMNQLNQVRNAQVKDYYERVKNEASGAGLGSLDLGGTPSTTPATTTPAKTTG